MSTTVTTKVAFIKAFGAIFAFKVTPSGSVCNLDDTSAVEFLTEFHENLSNAMVDAAQKSKVLMGLVSMVEKLGAPDEKMEQIAKTVSDFRDDMHIHRQAERDASELLLLAAKWEREQAAAEPELEPEPEIVLDHGDEIDRRVALMPEGLRELFYSLTGHPRPSKATVSTQDLAAANDAGEICPGCGCVHELPEGFVELMEANGFMKAGPDLEIQNGQEISFDKLPPEFRAMLAPLQEKMGSKMKIMVGSIK
jgi:hypothetical protein